jgi:predicted phosphodiesterase
MKHPFLNIFSAGADRGIFLTVMLLLCMAVAASQAQENRGREKGGQRPPRQASDCVNVPAHPFDIILARPTSNSVTACILCYEDTEGYIAYGTDPGKLNSVTPRRKFKKDEPAEIVIESLLPGTRYFYKFLDGRTTAGEFSFATAPAPGIPFTFTVTADSHLDGNTSAAVYQRTLANAAADKPAFHLELGDTFMSEKHESRANAAKQYLAQRYYFGQLCRTAPLFFVMGNHDGEMPRGRDNGPDSLVVWSNTMRKRFFPNPVPDDFYSGNGTKHPDAGLLQNYYSWNWGNALFIVLDPYMYSRGQRGQKDNWSKSLGVEQYKWLKSTLENSRAAFKFVFIHQLVGGLDQPGRGGAGAAPYYEWGGKNTDGSEGFKEYRPDWAMPIHQLLVKNHVNIVFHGHDHLYAKEDLNGIVHQEVPQPGDPRGGTRTAEEYGYKSGTIIGSSGHLRVLVSSGKTKVEYVRTDGSVADSYSIQAGSRP